jgi:MFS superfamily sulfate permease-like transporter
MKSNMQLTGLHGVDPFVGLYSAIVGMFSLVLIGVYTRIWIPVDIGIAIYISCVTWLFRNLQIEFIRIRWNYTDDEAKKFNARAHLFMIGNSLVMLVMLIIFLLLRHAI